MKRLLLRDDRIIPLTAKAFDTLLVLLSHSGQDISKDELMEKVWPGVVVEENNLTQNISLLRKALGDSKSEHRYIVTIPGRGYRFVESVKKVFEAEPEHDAVEGQKDGEIISANGGKAAPEQRRESTISGPVEEASFPSSPRSQVSASRRPASRRIFSSRLKTLAVVLPFAMLLAALGYWWFTRRPQVDIAVLPFRVIGTVADDISFGPAMTDALIKKLGNIRRLGVRPADAVTKFNEESGAIDPLAAGRELNVDWVLTGTVQGVGDNLLVTLQLFSVREGRLFWTSNLDAPLTHIFALQDSVAKKVAEALELRLTGQERERIEKHYTENIEADRFYRLGRFFWNKRDEKSLNRSIEYFEEAIKRDDTYALAYAGLADAHSVIGFYQFGTRPPEESFLKAKAAALRAIALDETLAEAHASLAISVNDVEQDEVTADLEFKQAIKFNPNYATAHHWYSDFLAMTGKHDKAMEEIKRALEIDPVSAAIKATLGERLYDAGRYDEAIAQLRKTLNSHPDFGPAHYLLGLALERKGLYAEAVAELNQALALSGENPWMLSALGHTLALSERRAEAQDVIKKLTDLSKSRYVTPYDYAIVYQGLGQTEQVVEQLAKFPKEKVRRKLQDDPRMGGLLQDPRVQKLIQ